VEESAALGEQKEILLLGWLGIGYLFGSYVGLGLLVIVWEAPHLRDVFGGRLGNNSVVMGF
jgi:hypothetical protein